MTPPAKDSEPEPASFWIGTSGWTYRDWKGVFYPENVPQKRWLEYYASQFSTVEINATFYGTFKDQTYYAWRDRTPPGFRFVLKAPRLITHRKLLLEVEDQVREFWRSASLLEEKLGLILLQVAPNTPYDLDRLHAALEAFGDPRKVAVEFRNDQWLTEETFALLRELGAVYCNPDSPVSPLSDILTSAVGYLRMHGRTGWYLYNYSDTELEEVAESVRSMQRKGAREVYVFFNNDYHGYAVENARGLRAMLESGA